MAEDTKPKSSFESTMREARRMIDEINGINFNMGDMIELLAGMPKEGMELAAGLSAWLAYFVATKNELLAERAESAALAENLRGVADLAKDRRDKIDQLHLEIEAKNRQIQALKRSIDAHEDIVLATMATQRDIAARQAAEPLAMLGAKISARGSLNAADIMLLVPLIDNQVLADTLRKLMPIITSDAVQALKPDSVQFHRDFMPDQPRRRNRSRRPGQGSRKKR